MEKITNAKFLELLKSRQEQIVFLFGAGLSLALGDKAKTWPGWLKEGRNYLSPTDVYVFDAAFDDSSAKGLINSAGTLFMLLKGNGSYPSFMHDTIESMNPVNQQLQEALVKLNRCGDFLATTNYDSLMEKSAGMGMVTYKEPESILKILKNEAERCVIHIHGAYADGGKTDNIVADASQYEAILENRGAQFLQQLMGTCPIVLVGCGNTVSDPNLHGFLFFAKKYLKSDIPCFYIYKEGEDIRGVPENCITICYGSEYSDFPMFLEKIASIRIQYKFDTEIMQFNPYQLERQLSTPYGRLHFANLFASFTGRKDELELLDGFLNDSAEYAWWMVLGNGGIGKSRLVLEWLKRLPSNWYGFFVNPDNRDNIADFQLFSNTVFVFDYIIGKEDHISAIIRALQKKIARYKVRILFIERSFDKDSKGWMYSIESNFEPSDRILFEKGRYGKAKTEFLMVSALKLDDEKTYMLDYLSRYLCQCADAEVKNKYYLLRSDVMERIRLSFRNDLPEMFWSPLYISIFLELWIYHDGNPHVHTGEEMLEKYMEKEEDRWKKIFGKDDLVYAYAKALTLACILEGYCISIPYGYKNAEIDALEQYLRSRRSPGRKKQDWSQVFIRECGKDEIHKLDFMFVQNITIAGIFDGKVFEDDSFEIPELDGYFVIEPEYPDLLKEFIVSYYVASTEVESFTKVMRKIDKLKLRSLSFLSHAIEDFPEEMCFRKILTAKPGTIHEHYVFLHSLLMSNRTLWFKSLDDIELVLLVSEYTAYVKTDSEVYLWGMLAECLIFIKDGERLLKFGMDFFQYLNARWETLALCYMVPVIQTYCRGFLLLNDINSLVAYVEAVDHFVKDSEKYLWAKEILLQSKTSAHLYLRHIYLCNRDTQNFEKEFLIIRAIYKDNLTDITLRAIYVQTLNNLIQLWSLQPEISQPEMAHKATLDLLDIYAITKTEKVAVVLSCAYVNEYLKYHIKMTDNNKKKTLFEFSKAVKNLLHAYPENTQILICYLNLLCIRINLSRKGYSILSSEDWKLFEKLSIKRPDCFELMVFYREGLEYKIKKTTLQAGKGFSYKKSILTYF